MGAHTIIHNGKKLVKAGRELSEGAVVIPRGIEEIGDGCFQFSDELTAVELPAGIRRIGNNAFFKSGLMELRLPQGVEEIGEYAFGDCIRLRRVQAGDVKRLGNSAFRKCAALEGFVAENGLTVIGDGCFYGCDALETVTLPYTVEEIGDDAFAACERLRRVNIVMPDGSVRAYDTDGGLAGREFFALKQQALREKNAGGESAAVRADKSRDSDADIRAALMKTVLMEQEAQIREIISHIEKLDADDAARAEREGDVHKMQEIALRRFKMIDVLKEEERIRTEKKVINTFYELTEEELAEL
ncbi:leucine-rich repeat domain-containing protein [uncultured Ruminococcus sp.]|uniref:leucine-rich repeat domain-containing protein n=2 Tax=uncultured Ruminococcus sp. TaxID=165186 RepID=UPI0025DD534A|nr:leucine-rich repeat domain-containing protein [uncultured Ruminococcus sp.]